MTICAKLFIGVSHINALHNWPTSRLFHTPFPRGCFHALPALFLLFLAFLDNQKEVEPSRLAESWNCPLSPPTFCLGFCYSASFFFPSFLVVEPDYIATISWSSCLLFFPSGSKSIEDSLWSVPWSQTLPPWFQWNFILCCWFAKAMQRGMYVYSGSGRW